MTYIVPDAELSTLNPGDIVRVISPAWSGAHIEGPLVERDGALFVGTVGWTTGNGFCVRKRSGGPSKYGRTVMLIRRSARLPRNVRL